LRGAPGVGKTFVARKLAYVLIGAKDDDRIETVQFHPSYSYEDFIRGYRPTDVAGQFELRDGPFLQFCNKADMDPSNEYVLILDEINRGNLSQIFGEMFSLLESDKRGQNHQITPLYRRFGDDSDRVFVPQNLFIIGTMNIADRSLALVDFALRRRFAFITLTPKFDAPVYRNWLLGRGMDVELADRIINCMGSLNRRISDDPQLGSTFQIGHSFFCPPGDDFSELGYPWMKEIIDTEIEPLLEEYWFGDLERDKAQDTITEVFGN
jgi:5-methylcytosine-specific restriction protein B